MMRFLSFLFRFGLGLGLVFPSLPATAQEQNQGPRLIRDTEIETVLGDYAAPLLNAAGMEPGSIRLYLVNDAVVNAFTASAGRIFVDTGLILASTDAGQVIGVLAHEMGHVLGRHVSRIGEGMGNASAQGLAVMMLGIPLALATRQPDILRASTALGGHVSTRSALAYTRGMEQAADQGALRLLDSAGLSAKGLETFLEILASADRLGGSPADTYSRTHPLTQDRIALVRYHAESAAAGQALPTAAQNAAHARIRAKLTGYLLPPEQVMRNYPPEDTSLPALYARAILDMRQDRTDAALAGAARLLALVPDDPFFHELTGDILFRAGRPAEAAGAYRLAIARLPDAALLHQSLARAALQPGSADLDLAVAELERALRLESWDLFSWRLLATAEGRRGHEGAAALALAEEAVRGGVFDRALDLAGKAARLLPPDSPGARRAADILLEARQQPEQPPRRP